MLSDQFCQTMRWAMPFVLGWFGYLNQTRFRLPGESFSMAGEIMRAWKGAVLTGILTAGLSYTMFQWGFEALDRLAKGEDPGGMLVYGVLAVASSLEVGYFAGHGARFVVDLALRR